VNKTTKTSTRVTQREMGQISFIVICESQIALFTSHREIVGAKTVSQPDDSLSRQRPDSETNDRQFSKYNNLFRSFILN
jgi:hypothetical protein